MVVELYAFADILYAQEAEERNMREKQTRKYTS